MDYYRLREKQWKPVILNCRCSPCIYSNGVVSSSLKIKKSKKEKKKHWQWVFQRIKYQIDKSWHLFVSGLQSTTHRYERMLKNKLWKLFYFIMYFFILSAALFSERGIHLPYSQIIIWYSPWCNHSCIHLKTFLCVSFGRK